MTKRIVVALVALVMIGLVAAQATAQDKAKKGRAPAPDVRGRVKSFDAETGELVVHFRAKRGAKPEEKVVKVTEQTKIKVGPKDGTTADLQAKAMVKVMLTTDEEGNKTDTAESVWVAPARPKGEAPRPKPKKPAPPKEDDGGEGAEGGDGGF